MMFDRNQGLKLSANFNSDEFQCTCQVCKRQLLDNQLLEMLQKMRDLFGHPIKITSGYRCEVRQAALRKQGYETSIGPSSHSTGNAVDVTCAPEHFESLCAAAESVFAKHSIGKASTWLHLDNRSGGPRRWSYKS